MQTRQNFTMKILNFMENSIVFLAIRQGLVSAAPLLLVGSFVLIFLSLPIDWYQGFLQNLLGGNIQAILQMIKEGCFDFLAIILLITISYRYARLKDVYKRQVSQALEGEPTKKESLQYVIAMNFMGADDDIIVMENAILEQIRLQEAGYSFSSLHFSKTDWYTTYGGFLFLGIFLGCLLYTSRCV